MKITVDQEGKKLLEQLCHMALQAKGIHAYDHVKKLESCMHMEVSKEDSQEANPRAPE